MSSWMGVSLRKVARSSRTSSRPRVTRRSCRSRRRRCVVAQTETEVVQGIGSDYEVKYGFSNPDEAKDYFFKSGRGLNHEIVEAISAHKNEPDWMRKFRHKSLDYFLARPLPPVGREPERDRLREHLLLHPPDREAGGLVGGPAGRHQGHLGQARDPGGREEVPRRRRRAVRVRGRLPQAPGEPREAGRDLPRHGLRRSASTRSSSSSTSGRSSRRTTTSSRR